MVSYPRPGFLSSATLPLLPKKHYNGLINQSIFCLKNLNRYGTCEPRVCMLCSSGASD